MAQRVFIPRAKTCPTRSMLAIIKLEGGVAVDVMNTHVSPRVRVMTKIVVENAIRSRLLGLETELELCDEAGVTLGYFVPRATKQDYEWARKRIEDDDLERARREPIGKTTAEVLAGLVER